MPDIDLGIPPLVIKWFMQDPFNALAIAACVGLTVWSAFNLDCSGDSGGSSDGCDGGGDGGGD